MTDESDGARVTTTVKSKGKENLAELYETIPVFLRETAVQKMATIQFQVDKDWIEATAKPIAKVKAVKIQRFDGTALITFARPVTAKLSPQVWKDGFQTQAECRTVLVELMKDKPGTVTSAAVEYVIEPK
jgi:hypothetical protein